MSKLTWDNVYERFKSVYPKLGKMSVRFVPCDYMMIVVYLSDGTKMIYDDLKKQARMAA